MPNNTLNIIVADKQLFNCVFKDGKIDTTRFLPEPNLLAFNTTNNNTDIVKTNGDLPFPATEEFLKSLDKLPGYDQEAMFNRQLYGYKDWLDFRAHSWGSKFGFYSFNTPREIKRSSTQRAVCSFETAWIFPAQVMRSLSLYTKSPITIYSICEGDWVLSKQTWQSGERVYHRFLDLERLNSGILPIRLSDEQREKIAKWLGYADFAEFLVDGGENKLEDTLWIKYLLSEDKVEGAIKILEHVFTTLDNYITEMTLRVSVCEPNQSKERITEELTLLTKTERLLNEEFKFLPNLLDVFGGDSSILTNLRSALYVNWLFEGSLLTIQYGYYSKFLLEKKK